MRTEKKQPKEKYTALWTFAGIVFLLLLWETASRLYGAGIILPGPLPVLKRFWALVRTRRFLAALGGSFLRVLCGIVLAVSLGAAAGIAAGLNRRARAFLAPLFSVISAVPVMAVILIAFLFLGAGKTPVFTAFLMIFPVIASSVIAGIGNVAPRLKELFAAFKMGRIETLTRLYFPSLLPFILGGLRSSLSLCWKVVCAAEVMVQPAGSLGAGMQQAKANLETPELFAWAAAAVIAAGLSQCAFSLAVRRKGGKSTTPPQAAECVVSSREIALGVDTFLTAPGGGVSPPPARMKIKARDISFAYNGQKVFERFSAEFESGDRPLVILGPSGSGKTTLLKLLGGLLKPQSGGLEFFRGPDTRNRITDTGGGKETGIQPEQAEENSAPRTAFMFQEPRLLPWLTVLENISLPLKKDLGKEEARGRARHFLSLVSLSDKAGAYPEELSGGEAQRVSMARAFAWPSPFLFMDEPFQSLDIPLRIILMDLCLSLSENEKRPFIAVTHDPREAVYMGGRIVILGRAGEGIVFDRRVTFNAEERAWGGAAAASLEKEMIRALRRLP